ncbi:hypothetical protein [uncultured Gammaproteobacteria bacterium]|nr:hypothetical protein [uncultured Gammaproteobacteria bacterium]VVH56048.1 hypothetical protein BSPCLSOX_1696 [uncultured Gammaproteobacteria bacterium]VVH62021.1 hypothetical protein BSPWISOX_3 [uncultured Gammaproteobacteria bacterium]
MLNRVFSNSPCRMKKYLQYLYLSSGKIFKLFHINQPYHD